MKRVILLATVALVTLMILIPTAVAQTTMEMTGGMTEPLTQSSGAFNLTTLLPASALILGSGIIAFAILRRR